MGELQKPFMTYTVNDKVYNVPYRIRGKISKANSTEAKEKIYNDYVQKRVSDTQEYAKRVGLGLPDTKEKYQKTTKGDFKRYKPSLAYDGLYRTISSKKIERYGNRDPPFNEVYEDNSNDGQFHQDLDNVLASEGLNMKSKNVLKVFKELAFDKLMEKTVGHDLYVKYPFMNKEEKLKMLMSIVEDNPFLISLFSKVAPFVAGKAMDWLVPKVQNWISKKKEEAKANSMPLPKYLQPIKQIIPTTLGGAYNLDPQDDSAPEFALSDNTSNPLPSSKSVMATAGLIGTGEAVTSDDVSITGLSSALWPEYEGGRVCTANSLPYTAVLQSSFVLAGSSTNNLGNLFITISPANISSNSFALVYNAAGATPAALGVYTLTAGPLFAAGVNNFATFRINGMSLQIKSLLAPINRSGTITVAQTNRKRYATDAADFANIFMSPIMYNESLASNDYFMTYIPDQNEEWTMMVPASAQPSYSDLLISIVGTQPNVQAIQVLISYTVEYEPTANTRPLVSIARPQIAPSTVAGIELIAKQYPSLLIKHPNVRGAVIGHLKSQFRHSTTMTYLSNYLSREFGSLATLVTSVNPSSTHSGPMGGSGSGGGRSGPMVMAKRDTSITRKDKDLERNKFERKDIDKEDKKVDTSKTDVKDYSEISETGNRVIESLTTYSLNLQNEGFNSNFVKGVLTLVSDRQRLIIDTGNESYIYGPDIDIMQTQTPFAYLLSWLTSFDGFPGVGDVITQYVSSEVWTVRILYTNGSVIKANSFL